MTEIFPAPSSSPPCAFITGTSDGVGRQTAILFARKGCKVIGVSRHRPEMPADIPEIPWFALDLSETIDEGRLLAQVRQHSDRVDFLVVNAAHSFHGPAAALPDSELDRLLAVNFRSAIVLVRTLLPLIPAGGRIVFVGSSSEYLPAPNNAVYAALKAAFSHLARSLDVELRPKKIRCRIIRPGFIATAMAQRTGQPQSRLNRALSMGPDQVAADILRLAAGRKGALNSGTLAKIFYLLHRFHPGIGTLLSRLRHG